MKASDIMTRTVITASPEDSVRDAARTMARHHVSALPVTDRNDKLVGIVSEGDLLRRGEMHTERHRSWWLDFVSGGEKSANDYVKAFGPKVKDVMTAEVATVDESKSVAEIAEMLESRRIKRVPVIRGGKIVGIVSRANLVQALASLPHLIVPEIEPDDTVIRASILSEVEKQKWGNANAINVVVNKGVVHLWGTVFSDAERKALKVAAEKIVGVKVVQDHLHRYMPPVVM